MVRLWDIPWGGVVLVVVLVGCAAAVPLVRLRWRGVDASDIAATALRRHSVRLETVAACVLWTGLVLPPMSALGTVGLPFRLVGHQLAALPMLALILVALVQLAGAASWQRRPSSVTEAILEPRTAEDITPRYAKRLARVWLTAMVAGSLAFGLSSSGLRSVSRVVDSYSAQTTGPWPGWLWTIPLLLGSIVAVLLVRSALRAIAAQPAADISRARDLAIRRRLASGLLRSAALVFGLSLAGLVVVAGSALEQLGSGLAVDVQSGWPGPASPAYQTAGTALVLVSYAIVAAALVSACWPERHAARAAASPARVAVP